MGTVHRLPASHETTLGQAVDDFLATIPASKHNTRESYATVLRKLTDAFGAECALAGIEDRQLAGWFRGQWGASADATWNSRLGAVKSAVRYWQMQEWITTDPARMLERRRLSPGEDRAMSRQAVEDLLRRRDIGLREKTLWRLAYESGARIGELLSLDIGDLDLPNKCARVRRKGGAMDWITWQSASAILLGRYLKGRKAGPVFLTERKALRPVAGDVDPDSGRARLSYRQAEEIFKAATGETLHVWRHTCLTHLLEDGTNIIMLKAISGHASTRSLERYARVSKAALLQHRAETDPARRKR